MSEIIDIQEYLYDLPLDRIANYPLAQRDQSKLLVYQNGEIQHSQFNQLPSFLPYDSLIFFNDTKVIPARIFFTKDSGAEIEIFLLSPVDVELNHAMHAIGMVQWRCTIGNLKRWPTGIQLKKVSNQGTLSALLLDRVAGVVKFEWTPSDLIFAQVLNSFGLTPLPPYIKRPAEKSDRERYQTIYSQAEGAVAAPTAGLHFTEDVIMQMTEKGMLTDYLTLHVSAGTFQPIKTQNALDHPMHTEKMIITRRNIENLLQENKKVVAVGTTSMRTLETIYWFGTKLIENPATEFKVNQFDPYSNRSNIPCKKDALQAILKMMEHHKLESIAGETSIYIVPRYPFQVCDALITNFHQPGSTLMLLVAAFVGKDWEKIYREALANQYRFLSYGDSSLLIPGSGDVNRNL